MQNVASNTTTSTRRGPERDPQTEGDVTIHLEEVAQGDRSHLTEDPAVTPGLHDEGQLTMTRWTTVTTGGERDFRIGPERGHHTTPGAAVGRGQHHLPEGMIAGGHHRLNDREDARIVRTRIGVVRDDEASFTECPCVV